MSTTKQDEMRDRVDTLLQDADWQRQLKEIAKAREQPATMHGFAVSEASLDIGRHTAATGKPTVVGSKPDIAAAYPAGPAWSSDAGSQLVEPPLGIDINAMSELGPSMAPSVEQLGGTEAPPEPSPPDVENVVPPPSPKAE